MSQKIAYIALVKRIEKGPNLLTLLNRVRKQENFAQVREKSALVWERLALESEQPEVGRDGATSEQYSKCKEEAQESRKEALKYKEAALESRKVALEYEEGAQESRKAALEYEEAVRILSKNSRVEWFDDEKEEQPF